MPVRAIGYTEAWNQQLSVVICYEFSCACIRLYPCSRSVQSSDSHRACTNNLKELLHVSSHFIGLVVIYSVFFDHCAIVLSPSILIPAACMQDCYKYPPRFVLFVCPFWNLLFNTDLLSYIQWQNLYDWYICVMEIKRFCVKYTRHSTRQLYC
jgi:hypothetical protein